MVGRGRCASRRISTGRTARSFTSDDVIFTVQMIQDPDANSPLADDWQGVSVSRVSELELQFNLKSPYAFFGDDLQNLYIIPKHLFADVPPGNWRLSDYDLKPIGSGPYQFVSYDKQSDGFISGYHLAAWSGTASAQPLIQNFDFTFFKNQDDLSGSFNAGQIDGFEISSPSELATIQRPYNLFSWRTPAYYAVFFNQSKNIALQDPNVRSALGTAVDRQGLVDQVLDGNGQPGEGRPTYGPIPPDAAYYTPIAETTSLELASETLTSAGWTVGADGFRSKTIQKSVIPLVVNLTVPQIDFLVQTADILQATWGSIGVSTTIATDSPETTLADTVSNRGYESLLFGNILGPSSDLYAFWDSSQRFSPGLNLAIYSDPATDKLIETAREDMDDASRTIEMAQAENDIVADTPAVFLYSPDDLYVANKDVQGITTNLLPDPSDRLREVSAWYLDTARVLK